MDLQELLGKVPHSDVFVNAQSWGEGSGGMNLPSGDHSQCDVFEASMGDNLVSERRSSMSIFTANFSEAAKEDQS